jgi:nitroreductase
MTVIEAIRARRSTKTFTATPVTRDQVETLLALAVLAPNHRMSAPWRFLVLGPEARAGSGQALGVRKARKIEDAEAARTVRERTVADAVAAPLMIAVAQAMPFARALLRHQLAGPSPPAWPMTARRAGISALRSASQPESSSRSPLSGWLRSRGVAYTRLDAEGPRGGGAPRGRAMI